MKSLIAVIVFGLLSIGALSKNVRIIGGEVGDVRLYPFIANFKHNQFLHMIGSGVIISNKHILTTAQVVVDFLDRWAHLRVFTGTVSTELSRGTPYKIDDIFLHPKYTDVRNYDEMHLHDIAVVKLKKSIPFNAFQNAIELLDRDVIENDHGYVLGWGSTTYPTLSYPTQMQKANMSVISENVYSQYITFLIHDTQFVAFDKAGVGPCVSSSANS
ncbi:PREDICTED: trypsin delta/gamma-like [Ceratosolen solmsi marchali]|uniref:Trypsin delta/gamma-like n=1 Tax=Ceratosolen solmsi marchali TaxID=326594 RepID=A0AAJ7E1W5_9HYME|nr:PREDICTED: trypsin delta/gamma-like [Ceratosolen solmsi marchali]